MTRKQTTFTVFAATLVLLAMFPMFSQPTAMAQGAEGGFGACILADAGCFVLEEDACVLSGVGLWLGDGSNCQAISTACCLGDGACAVLTPELCAEAGGTSSPVGTPRGAVTFPQPCAADVDGDGTVGILDFFDLLAAWDDCP